MSNPNAAELPANPDLEQQKKRAKELLKALRGGDARAFTRLRYSHPRLTHAGPADAEALKLADAQWVVAREYGFSSWPDLKAHIDALGAPTPPHRAFETDAQYYRDRAFGLASTRSTGERGALRIIQRRHPAFRRATEAQVLAAPFSQADAELVVAREHGFDDFAALEAHVQSMKDGAVAEPFRDAFEAVKADDNAAFVRLLDAHPDLANAQGSNGNRLINLACTFGRDAMLDALLERGADVNAGNNKGWTALHDVAGGSRDDGAMGRLERLLAAGASVEAEAYGEGGTPLAVALFWGKAGLAERLAREGVVPLNLRVAAGLGRVELMQSLCEADGSLRPEAGRRREFHRPHSGFPPWRPSDDPQEILDEALTFAARNGRVEAMEWLVRHGAEVNAEPYRGTPLAWAVRQDQLDAISWLLDHGAQINQPSGFGGVDGFTPLHLAAAWTGRPRAARLLLERGADIDALHREYNATPLSTSRYFDNPEVAEVIEAFAKPAALTVQALRPFIPCRDYEVSKRFYEELGFTAIHADERITIFELGAFSFVLQRYDWEGAEQHLMLQLVVGDVSAWWKRIETLDPVGRFGARAPQRPKQEPWGALVANLFDPRGVLWRISEYRR